MRPVRRVFEVTAVKVRILKREDFLCRAIRMVLVLLFWHVAAMIRRRLGLAVVLCFAAFACSTQGTPAEGGDKGAGGSDSMSSGGAGAFGSGGELTSGSGASPGEGGSFAAQPCEGLTLCDDFEGEEIDTAVWSIETSAGNSISPTTEQARHGSKSLHIVANNGYARLRNESAFPMPNNDYFGRMYLRVARFSTAPWAHWTVGEGAGVGDGSLIRVGGQYNSSAQANRWGVGTDGGPTGDWTMHDNDPPGSPSEPPVGTWVCLEWEHKGSANETRFFVDGAEHPSLATTATMHGSNNAGVEYILPEMTSFWFGFWQYQEDSSAPFDVWIDLVAIDDERIGCLP